MTRVNLLKRTGYCPLLFKKFQCQINRSKFESSYTIQSSPFFDLAIITTPVTMSTYSPPGSGVGQNIIFNHANTQNESMLSCPDGYSPRSYRILRTLFSTRVMSRQIHSHSLWTVGKFMFRDHERLSSAMRRRCRDTFGGLALAGVVDMPGL